MSAQPIPHDASYYMKCMVGGILSCGITHTVICPLDIIKCRKQVLPFLISRSILKLTPLFSAVERKSSLTKEPRDLLQ